MHLNFLFLFSLFYGINCKKDLNLFFICGQFFKVDMLMKNGFELRFSFMASEDGINVSLNSSLLCYRNC